jgi:hypothetical protein
MQAKNQTNKAKKAATAQAKAQKQAKTPGFRQQNSPAVKTTNSGANLAAVTKALSGPVLQQKAAVRDLVLSTVLPGDYRHVRVPSATPQKSAIANLQLDGTLPVEVTNAAQGGYKNTTNKTAVVVTGQAGVPVLQQLARNSAFYGNSLRTTTQEDMIIPVEDASAQFQSVDRMMPVDFFSGYVTPEGVDPFNRDRQVTLPTVRGDWMGADYASRKNCCYIPTSFTLILNVRSAALTTGSCNVYVDVWEYGSDGEVINRTAASYITIIQNERLSFNDLATTVYPPGYYQFGVSSVGNLVNPPIAGGIALSVAITTYIGAVQPYDTKPHMLPVLPPGLTGDSSVDAYSQCRVTALSLLCKNVTRVLDLEGTIEAARVDYNNVIAKVPTLAVNQVARTANADKRYYGALKDGCYTFAPLTAKSLEYRNYILRVPEARTVVVEPPDAHPYSPDFAYTNHFNFGVDVPVLYMDPVPYNVMYFSDATGGSQLATMMELHIEYLTDSPFLNVGTSTFTLEDLYHAQQLMSQIPYFYENPLHWAGLKNSLNSAWQRFKPYAGKLIEGAGAGVSAAVPELGPIPEFLAGAISRGIS